MEPAVERREHWGGDGDQGGVAGPQWSPPLKGGSTPAVTEALMASLRPQWSPPLKGGSTPGGIRLPRHHPRAAMEPAVERREHRAAPGADAAPTACRNGARR